MSLIALFFQKIVFYQYHLFVFLETNACDAQPCQNGATCFRVGQSLTEYVCQCPTGFSGTNCEISKSQKCGHFVTISCILHIIES